MTKTPEEILERAYELGAKGEIHRSVEEILVDVDNLLLEERLDDAGSVLEGADLNRLDPAQVLALVNISCEEELSESWHAFFARVKADFAKRIPDRADKLLEVYRKHPPGSDIFMPEHAPDDFRDPKPLKCPPYEPDPSQSCPYLHCVACKGRLTRGEAAYLCFACDAVYPLTESGS